MGLMDRAAAAAVLLRDGLNGDLGGGSPRIRRVGGDGLSGAGAISTLSFVGVLGDALGFLEMAFWGDRGGDIAPWLLLTVVLLAGLWDSGRATATPALTMVLLFWVRGFLKAQRRALLTLEGQINSPQAKRQNTSSGLQIG